MKNPNGESQWLRLGLAVAWTLTILYLCTLPASRLPESAIPGWRIPNQDKVAHALIFGIFGFLWMVALRNPWWGLVVAVLGTLYGGGLEWLQGWMGNGRTASLEDGIANATGVLIGVLAFHVVQRAVRRKSPPVPEAVTRD